MQLGRTQFLARYGYGKSRDFLVRDPKTGTDCDSKAIAGVAFGKQFPDQGPLTARCKPAPDVPMLRCSMLMPWPARSVTR